MKNDSTKLNKINYRPEIDGLRALAVGGVLIFHYWPHLLQGGFIGVDIFFVISGYLITRTINNNFSWHRFYYKRIIRIFPALILVLSFSLLIGYIILFSDEYKKLAGNVIGAAFFIPNIVFWKESGYFDSASELKILLNLWSLGVEEQFYLVWPVVIVIAYKFKINKNLIFLLIIVSSLIYCIWATLNSPTEAFFSPMTRAWELTIGGLSAINSWATNVKKYLGSIFSAIGLFLILASFFMINKKMLFPGYLALIPAIGTALFLIFSQNSVLVYGIFSRKILVFMGLISYPLYLWHWPILVFSKILLGDYLTNSALIICTLLSSLCALLTYYFLEKDLIRSNVISMKVLITLSLSMLFIVFISLYIFFTNGLPNRAANHASAYHQSKYL